MTDRREQIRRVRAARRRALALRVRADDAARAVVRLRWEGADAPTLAAAVERADRMLAQAERAEREVAEAMQALADAVPDGMTLQEWVEGRD